MSQAQDNLWAQRPEIPPALLTRWIFREST